MRSLRLLLALSLLVAACGGSGDSSPENSATPTTSAPTTTAGSGSSPTTPSTTAVEANASTTQAPASGTGSGVGTATVTLNGTTYYFADTGTPGLTCDPSMFGRIFLVGLEGVDGPGSSASIGGGITLVLLHDGVDPSEVGEVPRAMVIDQAAEETWIADPEDSEIFQVVDMGHSQVDEYAISGNTVSGTATFYEQNSQRAAEFGDVENYEVAQGTFEATCG